MNEETLFAEALKRTDPGERAAFLEQACGGDAELRRRVELLLFSHEQAGSFLNQPDAGPTREEVPGQWLDPGKVPQTPPEGVGSRIKQYKLLQQIGEGGMGVVFMAEQQEPVRRMVALKVIKAGMDSAQVIARFEQERQALALMDHPNIAKVLDAGTTASGRPYFVMELVKGIPITKYCDEQRLSPKQRLELFVPVCQAIQHAHQKGIIHRDIKPSNVLIAAYDGKPVPKVIDFGVAKATGQKLTERTLFTGFGGLVGTLEYMSPEQAEFNALDIDTRSDIYSLGVLLYELLTGTTPLSRQRIKDAAIMEVLRLIREEEPQKPSTRLSDSKDSLVSLSAQRQMEPAGLLKSVRGEVDWMVMKALEKDRTRRYETANGLARDIGRYLADEPVEAGPPSARYRLRKLAWKHRRGLAMAAALLLLFVVGALVSGGLALWALRAERQARDAAEQAATERDRALAAEEESTSQRERAENERDRAIKAEKATKRSEADTKAVLEYFQDRVLSAGRPKGQDGGLGKDVKLREAVDQARETIADSFKDRPLVEASIRDTLGLTYYYLGDYAQAIRQNESALSLWKDNLGPDHPNTLTSRTSLAEAYRAAGRTAEAIRLHEQTLKQREARLGAEHPHTVTVRNNLALAYWSVGRTGDAIRLHEQSFKQCEVKLGTDHPHTLTSRNNLALAYQSAGRTAEAIHLHEQNLKQREAKLGTDHPDTLQARNNLANAYHSAGRMAEAVRLLEQNLKHREDKLGADHPDTLQARNNLAMSYWSAGRNVEAIRLHEQNLKQSEAKLGADHPDTLISRNNLALAYWSAGRTTEAIRLHEPNLRQSEAKLGADHPDTLQSRNNLALAYGSVGRIAEASRLHEQNLKYREVKLGTDHPDTLQSRNNLAEAYWSAGRTDEAIHLHEQNLEHREAKLGTDHPDTLQSRNNLALAYLFVGRTIEALRLHEQNLKQCEVKLGTDHPHTLTSRNNLALAYGAAGRTAEAIRLHEQNLKQREAKLGSEHPDTFMSRYNLAEAYDRAGQLYKAEALYRAALEQIRNRFGNENPRTAELMAKLGFNLLHQHKCTDAELLLRDCLKIRQAKQPDKWTTFNTQSSLGGAMLGQKKYADAEPLLLKGYKGMKQREDKIPPQGKVRLREALERLVQLYETIGEKDEADKWRNELRMYKPTDKK